MRERDRETEKQRVTERNREKERQRDRETERQRDRETERQREIQTVNLTVSLKAQVYKSKRLKWILNKVNIFLLTNTGLRLPKLFLC